MNRSFASAALSAILMAALALPAASAQPAAWRQLAGQACAQASAAPCAATSSLRRALSANVAEYSFTVRVGPGEHDVIGLHRVVKERAPFVPARAADGIFLVHGDAWGFDAAFLASAASPARPPSTSSAASSRCRSTTSPAAPSTPPASPRASPSPRSPTGSIS